MIIWKKMKNMHYTAVFEIEEGFLQKKFGKNKVKVRSLLLTQNGTRLKLIFRHWDAQDPLLQEIYEKGELLSLEKVSHYKLRYPNKFVLWWL